MKNQFLTIISISLLFLFVNGFTQTRTEMQPKGIHQIEWEHYKDFKVGVKDQIKEEVKTRIALAKRQSGPSKEIFGYLPYWRVNNYPNLNYNLLTTIAYFGAEVNQFGQVTNKHDWPAAGLINKAHSEGVRVVLTAFLFNPTELASLLSDAARRTTLVNNLLAEVQTANADGVNIDFEGVPSGQKANLTAFITELIGTFHTNLPGSFVTIFTPAVDWSSVYDYFALAQIADGLVMQGYDYHWTSAPTAGPVAPLTGDRWGFPNVTWTVTDYLGKTFRNTSKLILAVPFYGREWPTQDDGLESNTLNVAKTLFFSEAIPNAQQYGRLWDTESQTPWYKYNDDNGDWHQGWYDDSLSMAKKYQLVNAEDLKGIAIWALSYDGERQEMQSAIADAFGATAAPLKPVGFVVKNIGGGDIQVSGQASSGATSYKIFQSLDGENFDQGTVFPGVTSTLSNLELNKTYYFKLSALNPNGESNLTEVLTVRTSDAPVNILIVNGFDRTSGTVNTFDFVKRFAPAVAAAGHVFDSCSNEAVQNGAISLLNYKVVLWISGEEGTANESFSNSEQSLIAEFLENGGDLFVSGSEIGFDLVERGGSSDKLFFTDYLKAEYVRDKVDTHTAAGTSEGIFSNLLNANFDNGTQGTYNVDFPDGIKPVGGAVLNLKYDGFTATTFGGAGIQYEGVFGNSNSTGKLVYLAFPFETLYPANTRAPVMSAVLEFFDAIPTSIKSPEPSDQLPGDFQLAQNYPNPFNPSTTIRYAIPAHARNATVKIEVFNTKGQRINVLVNKSQVPGNYTIAWNGKDQSGNQVASGVYVYRLKVDNFVESRKMTLLK